MAVPCSTYQLMPGLDPGIQTVVPSAPPVRVTLDYRDFARQ